MAVGEVQPEGYRRATAGWFALSRTIESPPSLVPPFGPRCLPPTDAPDNFRRSSTGEAVRLPATHAAVHSEFEAAVAERRQQYEGPIARAAWKYMNHVAAIATGEQGSRPLKCAFWMNGSSDSTAAWIGGPEETAQVGMSAGPGYTAAMSEAIRAEAAERGDRPVCVVHVRFHGAPEANSWTEEQELRSFRQGLIEVNASPEGADLQALTRLSLLWFRSPVLLVTDEKVREELGLRAGSSPSARTGVMAVSAIDLLRHAERLTEWVSKGKADLFMALTIVSPQCERRWMGELEPSTPEAVSGAPDLKSSNVPRLALADALGALDDATALWRSARESARAHIEAAIVTLSKYKLKTFEEKRQVAMLLNDAMNTWGFRPLSPHTQRPATLRPRQASPGAAGTFQFDEQKPAKASDAESAPKSKGGHEDAHGGDAQLPVFRLTDRPPDRRRRQP